MKFLHSLLWATTATAAAVAIEPRRNKHHAAATTATATATSTFAASTAAASVVSDVVDGQTIVLFELRGITGNECLTFRNNGEMVDAACVDTSADRQMTPDTIDGASVLRVQRTFTADFRADLVDVDVCVGFNGTDFRAEDCSATGVQHVVLTGGELRTAAGVCASGHDSLAQLTVDTTGSTCATYTVTDVEPATA